MELSAKILLIMVFGVTISISEISLNQFHSNFNATFPGGGGGGGDRLLQPIVIPNLTHFSNNLFDTGPKSVKTEAENKTRDLFSAKLFQIERRKEELFPETKNKVAFVTTGATPPKGNLHKFSSRYSSRPEFYEGNTRGIKERIDKPEVQDQEEEPPKMDVDEEEAETVTEVADSSDESSEEEKESENDIDSDSEEEEDHHESLSDLEDGDEQKLDVSHYENESKDAEETEIAPTTNEPYLELRRPTPFTTTIAHRPNEESEKQKTSSAVVTEAGIIKDAKKEEKRTVDDYDDPQNYYHSVQTPLSAIRFRGPQAFKDDYESEEIRTRLTPIRRGPVSFHWPYSKAQIKAEREKLNEIEQKEVGKWKTNAPRTTPKLLGLEKAVKEDEAGFEVTKIYNLVTEKTEKEKPSGLAAEEEKDHESRLFQKLRQYEVEQSEEEKPLKRPKALYGGKVTSYRVNTPREDIWDSGPVTGRTDTYQKLFEKGNVLPDIKPTSFNISRGVNHPAHQFLGPVVFNQRIEHRASEKPKNRLSQKVDVSKIFGRHPHGKEATHQTGKKVTKSIATSETKESPTQSFNHLEESDEMYNQILANIQSVFGIRTQPLKSAASRKQFGVTRTEQISEENKSLTWSVPLIDRRKQNRSESSVKRTESKEKSGSDGAVTLASSRKLATSS